LNPRKKRRKKMKAETAAMIMMSGSADLEDITITENGEYESVDHDGFDVVTVEVETYWDEYQQALSDLADAEACRQQVITALQEYDPDYDPAEGECPAPKVGEIVDHAKDCDDCKAEVVAKLQEYDPDFDPQTCQDIVDKIDEDEQAKEDAEEHEGYTFPKKPTGDNPEIDDILDLVGGDPVENNGITVRFYVDYYHNDEHTYLPIHEKMGGDTGQDGTCSFMIEVNDYAWGFTGHMCNLYTGSRIDHITIDSQDGHIEYDQYFWNFVWSEPNHGHWDTNPTHKTAAGSRSLIGYGDGSYKVKTS
jgi:hypothetical protein